jgi:hypothetical protein
MKKYQATTYLGLAKGQDLDIAASLLDAAMRTMEERRVDVGVVEIRKAPTLHSVRVELIVEAEGFAEAAEIAESFMNRAIVDVSDKVDLKINKDQKRLSYANV